MSAQDWPEQRAARPNLDPRSALEPGYRFGGLVTNGRAAKGVTAVSPSKSQRGPPPSSAGSGPGPFGEPQKLFLASWKLPDEFPIPQPRTLPKMLFLRTMLGCAPGPKLNPSPPLPMTLLRTKRYPSSPTPPENWKPLAALPLAILRRNSKPEPLTRNPLLLLVDTLSMMRWWPVPRIVKPWPGLPIATLATMVAWSLPFTSSPANPLPIAILSET